MLRACQFLTIWTSKSLSRHSVVQILSTSWAAGSLHHLAFPSWLCEPAKPRNCGKASQHDLNVRPETLNCRRNAVRATCREWCSDGAAMASTGAGVLGPVLAFRGEIEAQGRGSLHPHILVWLVCGHLEVLSQLTEMLRGNKT